MRPDGPRDTIIGTDDGPEPPFPLRMKGEVVKGFGRGSKEVAATPQHKSKETNSSTARYTNSQYPRRRIRMDDRPPIRHLFRLVLGPTSRLPSLPSFSNLALLNNTNHRSPRRFLNHNHTSHSCTLRFTRMGSIPDGHVHRLQPVLQKHSSLC